MEPSAKNSLNRGDLPHILLGTLVAAALAALAYLIGLGDELQHSLCAWGEIPCRFAPFAIPVLGFLLTALQKFRAGDPKPAPPAEPTAP